MCSNDHKKNAKNEFEITKNAPDWAQTNKNMYMVVLLNDVHIHCRLKCKCSTWSLESLRLKIFI